MRNMLDRYFSPLREGEGGGAGGGAADPGAAAAAAGAGGAGGQQNNGASAVAGTGAGAGAAAASGDAAAAAGEPYKPQGLPDNLFGANDRETIDRMAEALNGYRKRDSERGVPENADAYTAFDLANVDDTLKPHMESLVKDPLYKAVAEVAHAERVPVATMQKIVTTLYGEAVKAGVFEGYLDVAAERAQLLPETAQSLPKAEQDRAIDARLQENEDFLNLLAQPGADGKPQLDPKDAEHVKLMLMDSAAGNRFLEFFRSQMTGAGRAQPLGGGTGAGSSANATREALRARASAPEVTPGHPKFDRAKWDELQAEYQKLPGGR